LETLSTVGPGFVAGLFDVVERAGIDRSRLLDHAGVSLPSGGGTERLPMEAVIALFQSAEALTHGADIGLAFGQQVRPGTFHVLGYALMTCKTLGDAIALVPHYRRLVFDIGYSEMQFSSTATEARLGWQVVSQDLPYCPCLAESLIAAWYSFGRWMAGVDLTLQAVCFRHPPPQDVGPYARYFDCPVRFNAPANELVFARDLLDMPLVQADENLHLVMREQARAAMEKTFNTQDIAHRLRQALIPLMPKYEATLDKAAAALALSARSLQRRLSEQSLQFQDVLDAVRKDLARVYLRDAALSVLDVALLLGYAEQSSFTRAFKVWFKTTPSQWRRNQQKG